MTALAAQDLAIGHGAARVASGIDLALEPGTVTCLLGPNGVGKTTLFRTLLGLLPPQGGRVLLGGEDLRHLSREKIARRLAYVPQAHAGVFAYSVLDLVVMGRTAALGAFAAPGRADLAVARDALAGLGIADLAERDATRISGGQLQLALVARALAQRAGVIVMDEPTASLDLGNRIRVLDVVRRLADEGLAVLVSTHEPEQAFAVADRAAVIEPGGRFEAGPVGDLLTADRLSRLYGVDLLVETAPSGRRVVGGAPRRSVPSEPSPLPPRSPGDQPEEDAMADRHSERGDDGDTAGQRADPVAAKNEDLVQAGGPIAGEPGRGGSAYASGGPAGKGPLAPSGSRVKDSDVPASNSVAPRTYATQDRELRETEEKARRNTQP